jgi:transposase InsO family protein
MGVAKHPSERRPLVVQRKAKLTPAGRLLLVRRVEVEGWPAAHAAAMAGVSRCTAYKWLRRWREEGLAGLEDRSSRPRLCPRRTPAELEARIVALRREWRRGPHLLAGRLGIAPSTVHAVLVRHGLSRLSRLDRVTGTPIRYERDRPGELLHIDVKKLGRVPEGGGWRVLGRGNDSHGGHSRVGYDYLHVAIDDHSRVAFVEAHPNERGVTCASFLEHAIEFFAGHGVTIERVMTDNARNYTDSHAFQAALGSRRHVRIRPRRPQTNGKAERFNRTMLTEWGYARAYTSNAERLEALETWLEDYNWHRPHSGIGNRPPATRLPSTT